jgi:hypothetical protein
VTINFAADTEFSSRIIPDVIIDQMSQSHQNCLRYCPPYFPCPSSFNILEVLKNTVSGRVNETDWILFRWKPFVLPLLPTRQTTTGEALTTNSTSASAAQVANSAFGIEGISFRLQNPGKTRKGSYCSSQSARRLRNSCTMATNCLFSPLPNWFCIKSVSAIER